MNRLVRVMFVRAMMAAALVAGVGAWGGARAAAAEISATISSTQAVLGETLTLRVAVKNPKQVAEPEAPRTEDFEIQLLGSAPEQSSSTYVVNNRTWTEKTLTYTYTIRPLRTGVLRLPPFVFTEANEINETSSIAIRVSRPEGGELLMVEIRSAVETAYVGQPVDLTLEIWVKQYERDGFRIDVSDMWQVLMRRRDLISLGVFEKVGSPKWKPGQRNDERGKPIDYFVYLLETTVYPERPGPFEFGNITVGMGYPIALRRDVFGRISIDRERTVVQQAKAPSLMIRPIPVQGRPPEFSGAIGRFTIAARAKPTEVAVGDPITLSLTVRGQGTPLDRLSAPKLSLVDVLTKNFDVSGESPAGEVEDGRKVFAVTIRPLHEDIIEIPPLPMSYFDPATEQFATTWSQAIPIKVRAAERLTLLPQSGGLAAGGSRVAPAAEATEGLIANFTDPASLLGNQDIRLGATGWALLGACPMLYAGAWVAARRARRLASDERLRRCTRAYSSARRALAGGGSADAAALRATLVRYVADKFGADGVGLTRPEAVALIRDRGLPSALVGQVDGLLEELESAEYGGGAGAARGDWASRTAAMIDALDGAGG